ncbi:6200_t:CDS:2, partial [Funneliformis geosporum]
MFKLFDDNILEIFLESNIYVFVIHIFVSRIEDAICFKAEDIGKCLYKIRDDNVRPRHFLSTDNENKIEAVLSGCEGHSLHEYIDGDEPLQPIIDFDLLVETLDAITPKLSDKQ